MFTWSESSAIPILYGVLLQLLNREPSYMTPSAAVNQVAHATSLCEVLCTNSVQQLTAEVISETV